MSKKFFLWLQLVLLVSAFFVGTVAADGQVLTVPASVKEIEAEAFYANTSIETVVLPDGIQYIGSKAFAGSSVKQVNLPDSLTFIASDAFDGCADLKANVNPGSYAEQWCVDHGVSTSTGRENYPESAHPYADEFDYTWTYFAGADTESVTLTFSADTEVEDDFDYLFLYTYDGTQVGRYTGTELADKTVTIDGEGFRIRLVSDESDGGPNGYYGFRLQSITEKKAIPLMLESVEPENTSVPVGETVRWNVTTSGGKGDISYRCRILLGGEAVASMTISAPEAVEYAPKIPGEYTISITLCDSNTELPEQTGWAVTVVPSTVYPESVHPYTANLDQTWFYAAEESVGELIVTFSEDTETEGSRDYLYLYNLDGSLAGKYSGTELSGQSVSIYGSGFSIRLTSNGSVQKNGFRIESIQKIVPEPLSFSALTVDKTKVRTGNPVAITVDASGGYKPVRYNYTVTADDKLLADVWVAAPDVIEYIPTVAGTYTVVVTPEDCRGNATESKQVTFKAVAQEYTGQDQFTWSLVDGQYASVTGYTGTDGSVSIPDVYINPTNSEEYIVNTIASNAFKNNTDLVSIKLPDSIVSIQASAFSGCSSLKSVDLGGGVTSISTSAFQNCTSLQSFVFPDSVTTLGSSVLRGCTGLKYVGYPRNWTSANTGGYVFADCPNLLRIDVPAGTTVIPNYAFAYCANLREITLPEGLLNVSSNAFVNCTGLTRMVFPSTVEIVGGLKGCTGIKEVIIPEGATTVGTEAFAGIPLTQVSIPGSVTEISSNAFRGCTSLKTVEFSEGLVTIGQSAFEGCTGITEIELPDGLKNVNLSAFRNCSALTAAILPDSVETIGQYTFEYCVMLSEFHYPINWKSVDNTYSDRGNVFRGCESLTHVTIPEGVTAIPSYAFKGASYLRTVDLPSTLVTIGESAFQDCSGITGIEFPSTLVTIGQSAFEGCSGIAEIEFPDGLKNINLSAFRNCSALTAAILPDSVETIGQYAFENCVMLSEFHYPINWKSVDNTYSDRGNVFRGCESLTHITIPEGVTAIPSYAFKGASYLRTVDLPSTLVTIGELAFEGCTSLEKVYLSPNVSSIGSNAFSDCTSLTIHTEWGTYALQYAKDNGIPYFYLSLTGASVPSGTLYQGDSFGLHGYVRSSVNVDSVTATIYNADRSQAVQTITVAPGITDYDLSGVVNGSMIFNDLSLGTYHYELKATAGEETEVFLDTTFTIVPPPLRIGLSGQQAPSGILEPGGAVSIAGTIYSNYPITSVKVSIVDSQTGAQVSSYSASPGGYSFSIASAAGSLNISGLAAGSYTFRVDATSNGETRRLYSSAFSITENTVAVESENVDKLIAFVQDSSNRDLFTTTYAQMVIDDMSWVEYGLVIANVITDVNMVKEVESSILSNGQSWYLIDLYKQEIVKLLQDESYSEANYAGTIESKTKTFLDIIKLNKKLSAGDTHEKMSGTIENVNLLLDNFKKAVGYEVYLEDVYNAVALSCADISVGMDILDQIKAQADVVGNKEFETALEYVRNEYLSSANAFLFQFASKFQDDVFEDGVKDFIDTALGGSFRISFEVPKLVLKLGMKATGMGDSADAYTDFFIQLKMVKVTRAAYQAAFDTVAGGDTSVEALGRLTAALIGARSAWLRLKDTIRGEYLMITAAGDIIDYSFKKIEPLDALYATDSAGGR